MGRDSKTLVGMDDMLKWADMAIASTKKKIIKDVNTSAEKMQSSARSRHKFKKKTGATDKSIKADVTLTKEYISLMFWLDTSVSGIMLPSGYNKAWILNDGTRGNYKRGIISPSAVTVGGASGTGWKGDDFMGKTWVEEYKKLDKKINKAMDGIR